jgi:hypothetical protein
MKNTNIMKGEVRHCKFMLMENGKPIPRNVHEMIVQDTEGIIHRVIGEQLPSDMVVYTGDSHTGHNILHILLHPRRIKRQLAEVERDRGYQWPVGRDMLHVLLGFCLLQLTKATILGIDVFMNTFINAFYEALSH